MLGMLGMTCWDPRHEVLAWDLYHGRAPRAEAVAIRVDLPIRAEEGDVPDLCAKPEASRVLKRCTWGGKD